MLSIFNKISRVALEYPKLFLENLSIENWKRLASAIRNEPMSQIFTNIDSYFRRAKGLDIDDTKKNINHFVDFITEKQREIILFVSHEATRTGAPLIILKIAALMQKDYNIYPIFLLCKEGAIKEEFKKIGPCYTMVDKHNSTFSKKELEYFIQTLANKKTVNRVYINSAESAVVLNSCRKHINKIISLIHELGDYYPPHSWKVFDEKSDVIVFPSQFVKQKASLNHKFSRAKQIVRGQGLLNPKILKADSQQSKIQIRKELKLPLDSKIILGCGTRIGRKGIDLFTFTAIAVLSKIKNETDKPYFIWVGDSMLNEYKIWTDRDVKQSGYENHIRFIGERKDTTNYFLASDLFFMTSKGDPFPCVIHEAIAAKLPIIGFADAGGYVEILNNYPSSIVPYGNIYDAVNAILSFVNGKSVLNNTTVNLSSSELERILSYDLYVEDLLKL